MAHVAEVELRNGGAAVGRELDQTLGREPPQRLAQRRSRHAQLLRQRRLAQLRAAREIAGEDPLPKRGVDVVDDALDLQRCDGWLDAHGLCIHYAVGWAGQARRLDRRPAGVRMYPSCSVLRRESWHRPHPRRPREGSSASDGSAPSTPSHRRSRSGRCSRRRSFLALSRPRSRGLVSIPRSRCSSPVWACSGSPMRSPYSPVSTRVRGPSTSTSCGAPTPPWASSPPECSSWARYSSAAVASTLDSASSRTASGPSTSRSPRCPRGGSWRCCSWRLSWC